MNRRAVRTVCRLLGASITLVLSLHQPAAAVEAVTDQPKPGNYCPGANVMMITAEELSAGLDQTMRSRAALIGGDRTMARSELASVGTTLRLAASRGGAARTMLLVDAIVQSRSGEDYAQMLTWFPLLHRSLMTLPRDAPVVAADDLIGHAEQIMQGDIGGNAFHSLSEARHMLACDGLDIPLQAALQAQNNLMKQFDRITKHSAYDSLIDALRSALEFVLGGNGSSPAVREAG